MLSIWHLINERSGMMIHFQLKLGSPKQYDDFRLRTSASIQGNQTEDGDWRTNVRAVLSTGLGMNLVEMKNHDFELSCH